MARNTVRLGDLLVKAGKITRSQLSEILVLQKEKRKKIGELLIEEGIVSEEVIIEVLREQLGIEKVILSSIDIDVNAVRLVNQGLCQKYDLFPFHMADGIIKVAISDPLNIFAMDDVAITTGLRVVPYIATKADIKNVTERFYSGRDVESAVEEITRARGILINKTEDIEKMDDVKNAPMVKLVDSLIKNAIEQRASDIHIEPYEKYIRVRYRIDGELQEISSLNIEVLPGIVTRIKILANLNIAERRIPQDGRIVAKIGNRNVDMRVSIIPLISGEKVVIRILDRSNYKIGKTNLGMSEEDMKKIENIISSPHGIILVTGPTGSGKSTTLYTVLSELNDIHKNIVTVEDPVEYSMEGINQVNVNAKVGLTFAAGLRSILRQDPDVVMIGEMRDSETAEIGIRAAITGHLVLSTLHTNDAPSSVIRLIDMGIEPFLVATSIKGVIAQRLVKKICPSCKEEYIADEAEKKILKINNAEKIVLYKAKGCASCNHSGYSGRLGIYEIMNIDRDIKDSIVKSNSTDEIKDIAIRNGMKTIEDSCREQVLNGQTTIHEMMKIIFMDGI
ncbi:MAG: ATPase, T2SS/T4P/T4SS family [Clostridium sp.]|uniref:GspE/PulE family protein n=1 Tax=Clostridium sp. TaxID=1506 RepID=UPI0030518AFD